MGKDKDKKADKQDKPTTEEIKAAVEAKKAKLLNGKIITK